jgi:hypothetical protein
VDPVGAVKGFPRACALLCAAVNGPCWACAGGSCAELWRGRGGVCVVCDADAGAACEGMEGLEGSLRAVVRYCDCGLQGLGGMVICFCVADLLGHVGMMG